jgi:hypothetical protein
VRLEKDRQKKRNEKLSRIPEIRSERRENSAGRSGCGVDGCSKRFSRLRSSSLTDSYQGMPSGIPHAPFRVVAPFRRCTDYPRPTPTYSNPMARSRTESSRFLVSTMMGFLSRCLILSKSSARNSGQPVPTTSASMPSAAA